KEAAPPHRQPRDPSHRSPEPRLAVAFVSEEREREPCRQQPGGDATAHFRYDTDDREPRCSRSETGSPTTGSSVPEREHRERNGERTPVLHSRRCRDKTHS